MSESSLILVYFISVAMVTESKESRLRSDDFGKDIASVQALLSKQVSASWGGV